MDEQLFFTVHAASFFRFVYIRGGGDSVDRCLSEHWAVIPSAPLMRETLSSWPPHVDSSTGPPPVELFSPRRRGTYT